MALSYLFDPNKQFQDKNGVNNVGGYLYVFINDSDDHAPTYCNFTGTLNPERIVLDNNGRAVVIVDELKTYRIEVYDRSGNMLWSQYPVRPTNVIYGDYNVYNADIYGTPDEIDVDVETSASGVKKFTIKLANAVKTVIGNIQDKISSIVETVSTKADKVQGATAGNLAALDANGNLADSGKKTADFKTKQTAVSVTGGSLKGVASMSQNANGEVTLTLNDIQDGTTVQKGVVRLNNAIDSTSTTEAATPKAVKDAYDELNNKIVARAVFLSHAEWAVQSQLPGDPAKVYYVENGTGEDAYTVYVWKDSTSEYVEVDESSIDLDGYWHDAPNTTGTGNVVTNITLGNDGVPQIEKGMSAEPAFSVLPIAKGGTGKTTGKAATNNLFSDINNVNTDPDDTARIVFKYGSPSDSNGIFFARAITNLWNYIQNKISSVLGLTASSYGGKAATAAKNEDSVSLIYGMYAMEASSHTIPDLLDELKVLHGARCGSVYITSTYTKDNVTIEIGWYNFEYIPHRGDTVGDSRNFGALLLSGMTVSTTFYVFRYSSSNISNLWQLTNTEGSYPNMSVGSAATATHLSAYGEWSTWNGTYVASTPFALIGEQTWPLTNNDGDGSILQFERNNDLLVRLKLCIVTSGSTVARAVAFLLGGTTNLNDVRDNIKITYFTYTSNDTPYIAIRLYVKFTRNWQNWRVRQLDCQTADNGYVNWRLFGFRSGKGSDQSSAVGTPATYLFSAPYASGQVGSTSTPVYVDADGQVKPCGFQVNFGTPIAGANVLNIITA